MSNNFFTNISAGPALRSAVNTALGQIDDALTKFRDGVNSFVQLNFGATTTLTLDASGIITVTRSRHRVDTFAAVASDDLVTINGSVDGDELFLQIVNASRQVVVKHNTGNIFLAAQTDFTFTSTSEVLHLIYDAITSKWCEAQTRTSIVTTPYFRVDGRQAKNVADGTASAAAWNTRTLNAEVTDTGNYVSVASNQVTIQPGTYDIRASVPLGQGNAHKVVLWNDTDSTLAITGGNEYSASADVVMTRAILSGRITIASAKAFTLRHYVTNAGANGLGYPTNVNDPGGAALQEVYSIIEGWKVG